jgi:hypothetical protein
MRLKKAGRESLWVVIARKMSMHWTLPLPSHMLFNGACL